LGLPTRAAEQKSQPAVVTNDNVPLAATSSTDEPAEVERLAPYVGLLQGILNVQQVKKTRLIDITGTYTDPKVARKE